MSNYLLRNLHVVLKSDNVNTSTVEMIVEFDTLNYGVKFKNKLTTGDHIKLTYEINTDLSFPDKLYHNGFVYPDTQLDWENNKILTITTIVIYPKESEGSAVTKGEEDVIKPSKPLAS